MKRTAFLSGLALLVAAAGISCAERKPKPEPLQIKVATTRLEPGRFIRKQRVLGTIQAYCVASVCARVSGNLDDLLVTEGNVVEPDQILLYVDRENLENTVASAEKALKVAQETAKTTEADVAIAKFKVEKAQLDYDRAEKLAGLHAISVDEYESAELELKSARLTLDKCEAVARYTRAKTVQAELDLKIAKKNLQDSMPKPPYHATVTTKYKDDGDYVSAGTPIVAIENEQKKRVACTISAIHYDAIVDGRQADDPPAALKVAPDRPGTQVEITIRGCKPFRRTINTKSPAVDAASRTFTIRAYFPDGFRVQRLGSDVADLNPATGMHADVDIIFEERDGLGLPAEAILLRRGGARSVYVAENGIAREIPVQVGIVSGGRAEILNAADLEGRDVIVEGHGFVNDGSRVLVRNDR